MTAKKTMLSDDIKRFFKGEVITLREELAAYSEDASVFSVEPEVAVQPKNVDDLKNLVQFVRDKKTANPDLSITARSGGTDMSGGPLGESIVVDFTKHLKTISDVEGQTIMTEPGAYYRDFEKVTLADHLIMPSYPASKGICTVGGMVANNAGGEKSLSYGKTIDYVEELSVILSDGEEYVFHPLKEAAFQKKLKLHTFEGELYRAMYGMIKKNYSLIQKARPNVSKNSAGYYLWDVWNKERGTFDLTKVLVGSQGTLGLITKIKFRLVRPKPKSKMLVIFLNDLTDLGKIVHTVAKHKPETFESFDKHTYALALRFLPGIMRAMHGTFIKLAWQFLPELGMTLMGGIPEMVLIAEFTGQSEHEVSEKLKAAQTEVTEKFKVRTHCTKSQTEAEKYWVIRRESFNLLRQHTKGKHTAPFIDDIVVHPDDLPEFLPRLNKIFEQYPSLVYTIAGHAGDANFHIIPIMDLHEESERAIIPELSEEVYDLVFEFGGSIDGEHNDGIIRTPFVEHMFGPEMYQLFERTKDIFDPQDIFNPGKKVRGDIQYLKEHIKKN